MKTDASAVEMENGEKNQVIPREEFSHLSTLTRPGMLISDSP